LEIQKRERKLTFRTYNSNGNGYNLLAFKKKQSASIAEAEFIATSECVKKALWIRNILWNFFNITKPFKIMTDHHSSKTTLQNSEISNKLKLIEL